MAMRVLLRRGRFREARTVCYYSVGTKEQVTREECHHPELSQFPGALGAGHGKTSMLIVLDFCAGGCEWIAIADRFDAGAGYDIARYCGVAGGARKWVGVCSRSAVVALVLSEGGGLYGWQYSRQNCGV